jgi:hypothetical protein
MSKPIKGALFVEGKGEQTAAPVLLERLWGHLQLQPLYPKWEVLYQNTNLKDDGHLKSQLDRFSRRLRSGEFQALVVMFDSDEKKDGKFMCPKTKGPSTAQVLRAVNLPIPSAVVLPYKEYEHWFVACLPQWANTQVLDPKTKKPLCTFSANTNGALAQLNGRDGKGPIDDHIVSGEAYRETTHQLAMTHMLDFAHLQQGHIDPLVPAFGTLCRASQFIANNLGKAGAVYP